MDPFYLNIEDRTGIDRPAAALPHYFRQRRFVLLLDPEELLLEGAFGSQGQQCLQLPGAADPAGADCFCDQGREPGVGLEQPAAMTDPVGLVIEFMGIDFVKVLHFTFFQDLRMQPGDTVDTVAAHYRQVSHLYLASRDDGGRFPFPSWIRREAGELLSETAVDLLNQLEDAGEERRKKIDRPLLQRFAEGGMVGI